jgi:hypothetical protein
MRKQARTCAAPPLHNGESMTTATIEEAHRLAMHSGADRVDTAGVGRAVPGVQAR